MEQYSFESKLKRAKQHLQALKREIKRWLATHPYTKTGEFNSHTGEHFAYAESTSHPPDTIALLVGDCLFNLRACLDHLVYSLAVAHSSDPLPAKMAKDSAFPICIDPGRYRDERTRKIGGIAPRAQTEIERLQPYHTGNQATSHALWVLDEFCNIDKHRDLHLLLTVLADTAMPMIPNVYFEWLEIGEPRSIEGKTQIAHYRARTLDLGAAVNVDILFAFEVAFERPPLEDFPVGTTLDQIVSFIEFTIIPKLRPFL
jgi:hypothetical protein